MSTKEVSTSTKTAESTSATAAPKRTIKIVSTSLVVTTGVRAGAEDIGGGKGGGG